MEKSQAVKKINFSVPNALMFTNVVIVVEGKEFHVLKEILGNFSTKFSKIFKEHPKESRFVNFLTADKFQEILETLYHITDISEENAFRILETALHLEMPLIKAKAIRAINKLTDSQCSYKQRIEIADKLELDELMDSTFNLLNTSIEVKLAMPDDLKLLRHSTVVKLLEKLAGEVEKEDNGNRRNQRESPIQDHRRWRRRQDRRGDNVEAAVFEFDGLFDNWFQ